jgi:hypothetical protein
MPRKTDLKFEKCMDKKDVFEIALLNDCDDEWDYLSKKAIKVGKRSMYVCCARDMTFWALNSKFTKQDDEEDDDDFDE